MDKAVQKLVALGVPGLVLLVIIATGELVGAAAIVAALAFLGGPFGLFGGIAAIAAIALASDALAEYGFEAVFGRVVVGLREKGMSVTDITQKVKGYPLSASLKKKLIDSLEGQ